MGTTLIVSRQNKFERRSQAYINCKRATGMNYEAILHVIHGNSTHLSICPYVCLSVSLLEYVKRLAVD